MTSATNVIAFDASRFQDIDIAEARDIQGGTIVHFAIGAGIGVVAVGAAFGIGVGIGYYVNKEDSPAEPSTTDGGDTADTGR